MAESLERSILTALADNEGAEIETWSFSESLGVPHVQLIGVLKSLEADFMCKSEPLQTILYELTPEGEKAAEQGSVEFLLLEAVPEGSGGVPKPELEAMFGAKNVNIGFGKAVRNKWLGKGEGNTLVRLDGAAGAVDITRERLLQLKESSDGLSPEVIKELKSRNLLSEVKRKSFKVCRGPEFALERRKKAADLTREMMDSGEWETTKFKDYNFKSLGMPVEGGNLHPLLKVRAEFRKILLQMGFEEMPTNRWVESSFWNFDALFQPQSHPARDAHDTFFIAEPAEALSVPEDYCKVVQEVHEKGGYGSIGYRYDWKRAEAMKNLLRTHTTAVSTRMLYLLANQEGGFKPKRYFSIDRVFRNESMDATHLCEFHQVEGLVADRGLTLGDLIGTIKAFFEQIGITQVRFKPAYNPYTEPSMEIFGYHPDLKKWTEIGNSGMFRPEMLRPMGLPEDVRVIAWGLSLERPTMIKYRLSNIRDLFGHKADLARTARAPICRFDV